MFFCVSIAGPSGTLRQVFLSMRAGMFNFHFYETFVYALLKSCVILDENHHREVNHTFANLGKTAVNPFPPGF